MRSPPLEDLYDLLREDGFAIGVDDHIRVGRLLARDIAWTSETLRTSIAALVVTDPHERAAFDACWERWMRTVEPSRPPEGVRPALPAATQITARRIGVIGGVVTSAIVAIVLAVRYGGEETPSLVEGPAVQQPVTNENGSGVQSPLTGSETPPLAPSPTNPLLTQSGGISHWILFALAVGAVVLAAAVVAGAFGTRARRRFLPGPWRYVLAVPPATKPVLPRSAIEDAAAELGWQTFEPSCELDLARSVAATVECGGLPTLIHRRSAAAPRYLVLEDSAGGADRWKFIYDELLRGLVLEGVNLERYTFAANPKQCDEHDGRVVALSELADHVDALIVIGNGDAAIDPIDYHSPEWLTSLRQIPQRLWINPLPPARWSAGARAIALDTPMAHGVTLALAALHAGVDTRKHPDKAYPAVIERSPGTASGIASLGMALGERAFRLVAAVAVIGPPTIATARWLAELHALELDERDWLGVATLPWFRTGRWPEGVRGRLTETLAADHPDLARALAATADRLFAASEPPPHSAAHLAWQLDGAYRAGQRDERAIAVRSLKQLTRTPVAY